MRNGCAVRRTAGNLPPVVDPADALVQGFLSGQLEVWQGVDCKSVPQKGKHLRLLRYADDHCSGEKMNATFRCYQLRSVSGVLQAPSIEMEAQVLMDSLTDISPVASPGVGRELEISSLRPN